jgi:hypothetical protein
VDLCLGLVFRVFTLPDLPRVHFVCLDHSTYTECFTRPARLNFAWDPQFFPYAQFSIPSVGVLCNCWVSLGFVCTILQPSCSVLLGIAFGWVCWDLYLRPAPSSKPGGQLLPVTQLCVLIGRSAWLEPVMCWALQHWWLPLLCVSVLLGRGCVLER